MTVFQIMHTTNSKWDSLFPENFFEKIDNGVL